MHIGALNSLFRSIQKKKPGKLWYLPTKISIETGNICNLCCPLCPTNSNEHNEVKKGFMTIDSFKVIFDKIKPFVKTIDLFSWGEPFLNRDLGKMIEYARKEKPPVRIFIDSNFNLATDDQIDALVRYGADCLKISCDGVTQDTYQKYRIGGNLEAVMGNIEKVLKKKYELDKKTPKIVWKYLVFKHNEDEVEHARRKAREIGIEFEPSGMRVDCGREIFEKVEDSVNRDREWIPESDEYNQYKDLDSGKKTCEKPWKTATINWNGDVVACGAIYDCERYSFGNLLKQSFKEIWNGEKYVAARKIIAGGKSDKTIICHTCKENGYQHF
ncbi:MAG: radical SAM protein [Candidatus Omnitrophota bacterium]